MDQGSPTDTNELDPHLPPPDTAPGGVEAFDGFDGSTEDDLPEDATDVRGTRAERFARRPWYTRAVVMLLAVTALAAGLRFWHLSEPHGYIFDEVYYAKDGCYDAGYPFRQCHLNSAGEQTVTVHPPLGREAIALSERLFGNREFGWRFGSAVAGTLSVFALAVIGWQLFGSVLWGGVAGLLLATENLNLVQSRISMLDIYVTVWVVLGFMFLLLDRRWIERRTPVPIPLTEGEIELGLPQDPRPAPLWRPLRLLAGLAFGAALSTKWSGATALIGGLILAVVWERSRRKAAGVQHPMREALRDETLGILLFLVLLPAAVYLASYTRWFIHHGFDIQAWFQLQRGMADFSLGLRSPHPYASPAWKWILMIRPVAYYFQCPQKVGANCVTAQAILGMGNPFVFWASIPAFFYAGYVWIWKRRWQAGFVVVTIASQYFPWFLAKRTSFLFYMAPITPFLCLALAFALRDLAKVRIGEEGRTLAPAAAVAVLISVAMFAFFWPILTGMVTSYGAWHIRMWMPSWV